MFPPLPLTTTNESTWKNTVKYLSKCPEKPDSADTGRHIDASTRVADPGNRDVSPDRQAARTSAQTPKKGLAGLSALASATPCKAGVLALPRVIATVKNLQLGSLPGFKLMWKVCLWILWRSRIRTALQIEAQCAFEDSSSVGRDEPHLPAHLSVLLAQVQIVDW